MVSQVLSLVHDYVHAAHPGVDRTIEAKLMRYWWPSLRHDFKTYVASCHSCVEHKCSPSHPVPLGENAIPLRFWDRVAIDLLKLPCTTPGLQYLYVCTGQFLNYVILVPLKDKSAVSVAQTLIAYYVINPFTTPKIILSDNGTELRSEFFA